MSAAITVTPARAQPGSNVVVAGTGFTASTKYTVTATAANITSYVNVTSDGSGAWSFNWPVGTDRFQYTFSARPAVEHTGGTSAAATATLN